MASLVEELVSIIEEEIVLYRQLVEYGEQKRVILIHADVPALEKLTALLSDNPRRRFSLGEAGYDQGNYTVWNLQKKTRVDASAFLSMGRSTPFDGMEVYGTCIATVYGGKCVWNAAITEN